MSGSRLHAAAAQGDLATVEKLLNESVVVDETDDVGMTPLLMAIFCGHTEVVTMLLDAGADPNYCPPGDRASPLWRARDFGFPEMAEVLVRHGARTLPGED